MLDNSGRITETESGSDQCASHHQINNGNLHSEETQFLRENSKVINFPSTQYGSKLKKQKSRKKKEISKFKSESK